MHVPARPVLAAGFAFALTAAFFATRGDAQMEAFKEVASGIWFRQGDVDKKGHCNNIVIEMKEGLLVVDANFPSGAQALMADIRKVSKKPVKWVFDTHHHGDHAYANAWWTAQGAETFAYRGVAEEMKRYEPKRWLDTAKSRPDVAELNKQTAEPPQKTFDKSPYVVDDGTRRVEFYHFGWAHTRGDGFAYLPKEKIICTGDAAANGPYNYTADGNIANWPKVLARAAKLDVRTVLPGHGPVGGPEVLTGQAQFMDELRKAVAAEVKAGKKATDFIKMDGERPLFTELKLPDAVKNWRGPGLARQAKDAYEEIVRKKPSGDLPH
jgi:glyoxylase-like metal-dependent hydrolase (beta-lactamase superfamily II)